MTAAASTEFLALNSQRIANVSGSLSSVTPVCVEPPRWSGQSAAASGAAKINSDRGRRRMTRLRDVFAGQTATARQTFGRLLRDAAPDRLVQPERQGRQPDGHERQPRVILMVAPVDKPDDRLPLHGVD